MAFASLVCLLAERWGEGLSHRLRTLACSFLFVCLTHTGRATLWTSPARLGVPHGQDGTDRPRTAVWLVTSNKSVEILSVVGPSTPCGALEPEAVKLGARFPPLWV